MKKLLSMLLVLAMAFTIVGCTTTKKEETVAEPATSGEVTEAESGMTESESGEVEVTEAESDTEEVVVEEATSGTEETEAK